MRAENLASHRFVPVTGAPDKSNICRNYFSRSHHFNGNDVLLNHLISDIIRSEAIMRTTNAISALNLTDLNSNGLFDILFASTQRVRVYIAEDHLNDETGLLSTFD
jgi:hypothetical protein